MAAGDETATINTVSQQLAVLTERMNNVLESNNSIKTEMVTKDFFRAIRESDDRRFASLEHRFSEDKAEKVKAIGEVEAELASAVIQLNRRIDEKEARDVARDSEARKARNTFYSSAALLIISAALTFLTNFFGFGTP